MNRSGWDIWLFYGLLLQNKYDGLELIGDMGGYQNKYGPTAFNLLHIVKKSQNFENKICYVGIQICLK